ncbi:MAG TPA: PilC/PilY family type IV pilus protein [Woeseiaceae bacterium]|nr:PilC/PilY family type IV pilus protein [Woeseiaceae bacterium]
MNRDSSNAAPKAAAIGRLGHVLAAAAMTLLTALPLVIAAPARAQVAQSPLFLNTPVNPNLILAIDDSGSMDSEVLMPTNDGALWWNTTDQSFTGRNQDDELEANVINFNHDGAAGSTWKKYVYLFPNGTGITDGRRAYADARDDHFAVPPVPAFAFARSPEYNAAYFNPTETYVPWPDVGGYTFDDANPLAAKTDPVFGTEVFDLTAERAENTEDHVFHMYPGMTLPVGRDVCVKPSSNGGCTWETKSIDEVLTGEFWVGMRYFPATFYVSATATLPDEYLSYKGTTVPTGYSPGALLPDLVRYQIKPENFGSSTDYAAAIQNFANWFTYYRKRHLATRGGIAASFQGTSSLNAASFVINDRIDVTMRDLSVAADRTAFFKNVLTSIGSGGTPNREALYHAGKQYQRTDAGAPITQSCQQNFTALFTDGYSNPTSGIVGNEDAGYGAPFEDTASGTIADIAMHYYKTNLRPDLKAGRVTTPQACATDNPDPWLDCNENLHMGTFGVLLGNRGQVYLVDDAATQDPYTNTPTWPSVFPVRHPSAVDDLWHATINSRGAMLSARRPSEISEKFSAVLTNIADRVASSAAVAANSTRLDSDTAVFQAAFDSTRWSGKLQAFRISMDGTINNTPVWKAAEQLDSLSNTQLDSRRILTVAPPTAVGDGSYVSSSGGYFTWAGLATSQQDALRNAGDGTLLSITTGQERLAYLRGSRWLEQPGGYMRQRDSRLGDIVNSDPQFVHHQNFGYVLLDQSEAFDGTGVGEAYQAFRASDAYLARPPVVVVGANDGMLHGFDASLSGSGGSEMFAFVPNAVYDHLYELTLPDYPHRFYVDSSPRVADVWFGNAWHTIVVGATGAGGRSVFALDVTDPTGMTGSDVLWEFTHDNMGYTIGQPAVAPLPNGEFGVVITSGYETPVTGGTIWILDPSDGSIIWSVYLPTSGDLGAPLVVDLNSDRVADRIYVGDTDGNLWRFDLESSNTGKWEPPIGLKQGADPGPLFVARDALGNPQAITAPLQSAFNDDGLHTIFFGTGSFYRIGDNFVPADPAVNSFYAIIDHGDPVSRADLLEQTIIAQDTQNGTRVRAVSQHDMQAGQDGWYLDLVPPDGPAGERVVSKATVRGDRVIFATLIPSQDPCAFGGDSWLMELSTFTGGRLEYAVFDLDGDMLFEQDDWILVTDENGASVKVPPSAIAPDINIVKTPAIIAGVGENQDEVKIMSGSSGELIRITERGDVGLGRQSWQQLR